MTARERRYWRARYRRACASYRCRYPARECPLKPEFDLWYCPEWMTHEIAASLLLDSAPLEALP